MNKWKVHSVRPSSEDIGKIAVFFECEELNVKTVRVYRDQDDARKMIPVELEHLELSTQKLSDDCEALCREFVQNGVTADVSVLASV